MSWLSSRLAVGRLRTGPTVLTHERSLPEELLGVVRLADPDAKLDGDDIVLAGLRITPGAELDEPELRKLDILDETGLWAYRIVAGGSLPMPEFDRAICEGLARRLGGWAMMRGLMSDPSDDDSPRAIAYLGEMPPPEEMIPLLREHLRPADSLPEAWQETESAKLDDGIIHSPGDFNMYGGADIMVIADFAGTFPPAVHAVMPYATQVARIDVVPFEDADGTKLLEGDQALLDIGAVALAMADAFGGLVTDQWGFQITAPEDLVTPDE